MSSSGGGGGGGDTGKSGSSSPTTGKKSERKRQRERQRRYDLANAFDELAALVAQVETTTNIEEAAEPGSSSPSGRRKRRKSTGEESADAGTNDPGETSTGLTRLDLIGRTIDVVRQLHRENTELKAHAQQRGAGGASRDDQEVVLMVPTLTPFVDPSGALGNRASAGASPAAAAAAAAAADPYFPAQQQPQPPPPPPPPPQSQGMGHGVHDYPGAGPPIYYGAHSALHGAYAYGHGQTGGWGNPAAALSPALQQVTPLQHQQQLQAQIGQQYPPPPPRLDQLRQQQQQSQVPPPRLQQRTEPSSSPAPQQRRSFDSASPRGQHGDDHRGGGSKRS